VNSKSRNVSFPRTLIAMLQKQNHTPLEMHWSEENIQPIHHLSYREIEHEIFPQHLWPDFLISSHHSTSCQWHPEIKSSAWGPAPPIRQARRALSLAPHVISRRPLLPDERSPSRSRSQMASFLLPGKYPISTFLCPQTDKMTQLTSSRPIKDALDHIPTSTINYSPKSFPAISHALFLSHLGTLQAEIWRLSQEVVDTDVAEADLGNQRQRIWNFAEAALGKLVRASLPFIIHLTDSQVVCVECDKIHPQSWLTKQAEDVKISMKEKIVTNLAVLDDLRSKLRKLEIDYIVMSHTAGDDGTGTRD